MILLTRKPDTTMEEFMNYYDNNHMKWIQSLTGPVFPLSHTRHYVHRTSISSDSHSNPTTTTSSPFTSPITTQDANATTPATVFWGQQHQVQFDVIAEMTFKDEEAFKRFSEPLVKPEIRKKILEDEMNFLDPEKTCVFSIGRTTVQLGEKE